MNKPSFQWLPYSASNFSGDVDALYFFMLGVSVIATLVICVMIIGFGIYYRRGSKVNRENQAAHGYTELVWGSIPLVFSMIFFAWGATIFYDMHTPPEDTLDIEVVGKQWMWKTQHPGGRAEINSLHVPVGQPVRLRMISEDVIHSFFIPAFRVKQDVLPAYYSQLWFTPTRAGTYHLFCAEYCGTEHSGMVGTVTVLEQPDYARWLAGESGDPPAVVGQKLFERFRCDTCHKKEGTGNGPSLEGVFGKLRPLAGGGSVTANEQYLRDSILNPHKQILAGFQAVMPNFQGQISEADAMAIIAYIKTLKPAGEKPEAVPPKAE
ncbi:cytochrome c oxidase subunit II [Planctomicrobium sp. SH661]|uniref:cytochrome c oxidase subunit II n=1 Tax=Planctomicrobium sp. SH661 TaxID=3448124 RepID=UPI003F5C27B1